MGRHKKITETPIWSDEQPYSFDLDTILFLAELPWEQRIQVQKRMVETAKNKKCMSLAFAKKVAKEIEF
jgi:hypothetical protein